jgi:DNA-binding transcriptional ArsR family regulator
MARALAGSDPFHAIAERNRRTLLDLLRDGEQPVGELVETTGLSYPLVSQHLRVLVEAGVVARRAEGRQRIYRLDAEPLRGVHDWTAEYARFWSERLARLHDRLER